MAWRKPRLTTTGRLQLLRLFSTLLGITLTTRSAGPRTVVGVIAFYEKVIKVKADVAAYLINCFPSA